VRSAVLILVALAAIGCGGEEPAAALHNRAVAALQAGDLVAAEIAAEKAAARGGPELEGLRDFVIGNAAFVRCEKEELAAYGPRGAAALETAIGHAKQARDSWALAAARRADWPEARRNVERARIKLDLLAKKKDELTPANPPPKPKPPPPPKDQPAPRKPEDFTPAPRVDPQLDEVPAEDVVKLLEKLKAKEQDKLRVRRAERQSGRYAVERDW
jgi:hypothetical protein